MSHDLPDGPGAQTPGRVFINGLCIQCGLCLEFCPAQAICVMDTRYWVNGAACTACLTCLELCPVGAAEEVCD